jgi:hypothetical protein
MPKNRRARFLSSTENIAVAHFEHGATVPDALKKGGREWLH